MVQQEGVANEGYEDYESGTMQNGFLSSRHSIYGDQTYVYEPDKSFRSMTLEVLPSEENYNRLAKNIKFKRPTIDELMTGKVEEQKQEEIATEIKKGKIVKFGWLEGVLMRCLLNIWGVMLFLRLSWVIGQAGFTQGLLIISLANSVTAITAISMSAVATNGQIASGGVYYMISRALGPEFGGAIGLMFTIANSISVATYTIGFCDNILDLVFDLAPNFKGIIPYDEDCTSECRLNDLRIMGTPVIVLILCLAIVGMDWVTRVQKLLLVTLLAAQVDMIVGSFVQAGNLYTTEKDTRYAQGFTSWSMETYRINEDINYDTGDKQQTFMSVFGVFFTAVTGIVAGANLSGDLKDPSSAIPKGTLIAIALTYVSYMFFGILVAFNYLPRASGDLDEYYGNSTNGLAFDNCSAEADLIRGKPCEFGAAVDQKVMMYISYTGYLVYFGCYAATLSSAIASLVGAPRVLQAVGRDKIYPKIVFFAKGHGANNDPVRGYILVFAIAFGCLMIARLNTIGSLASNFFLAAYALMNLSVFHSSMTKSPGWRPTFKFYNPWASLIGCIGCVILMFAMEWRLALATVAIIALLYALMLYLKPEANWGSSAEALTFLNALNNTYSLNDVQDHIKTYRPKILLLSGNPAHRQPLVDFANLLTKKLSLLICAHIVPTSEHLDKANLTKNVQAWLRDRKVKSFYTIAENDDFSSGVKSCISLVGLGRLAPNMILMGYRNEKLSLNDLEDYVNVLITCFECKMSVGILRMKGGLDFSAHTWQVASEQTSVKRKEEKSGAFSASYIGENTNSLSETVVQRMQQFTVKKRTGNIDVWWLYDDGGLTLLLPYILQTRKQYKDCKLRVFSLANKPGSFDQDTRNLANLIAKFRIDYSEVHVIPDITKKALQTTQDEFEHLLSEYPPGSIDHQGSVILVQFILIQPFSILIVFIYSLQVSKKGLDPDTQQNGQMAVKLLTDKCFFQCKFWTLYILNCRLRNLVLSKNTLSIKIYKF
jgi:solute carrier family 12 sodium/potassium/chloride transporter 2